VIINFLTLELYPDTLEKFLRLALQDYVYKHKGFALRTQSLCVAYQVLNHKKISFSSNVNGDIILDVKFRFVNLVKNAAGKKVLYFPDAYGDYKSVFDKDGDIYDYIFFGGDNLLIDNKRYFCLSAGYCPYTHYPIQRKKTKEVCFIGTKHEGRDWIAGIPNIEVYGNGWGRGVYEVYGADKREIVAQSKILLNCHVDESGANMRDYELLAMGAFVLSDFVPECLKGGMVKYDDYEDLCAKIDYYLNHEEEREKIAMKGREIVKPYTYEKRCEEMLNIIVESGGIESD
jgi:hypothetical protein